MDIPEALLQAVASGKVSPQAIIDLMVDGRAASSDGNVHASVRKVSCAWEEEDDGGHTVQRGCLVGIEAAASHMVVMAHAQNKAEREANDPRMGTVVKYWHGRSKIVKGSKVWDDSRNLVGTVVKIDDGLLNSGNVRLMLMRKVKGKEVRWMANLSDCHLEQSRTTKTMEVLKAQTDLAGSLAKQAKM